MIAQRCRAAQAASRAISRRSAAAVARQREQRPGINVSALTTTAGAWQAEAAQPGEEPRGLEARQLRGARDDDEAGRGAVAQQRPAARESTATARRAPPASCPGRTSDRYFSSTRSSTCTHSRAASGISSSLSAWPVGAVSTTIDVVRVGAPRRTERTPNSSSIPGGASSISSVRLRAPTSRRAIRHRRRVGDAPRSAASSSARRAARAAGASSSRTYRLRRSAGDRARPSPTAAPSTSASECAGSVDSSRNRLAGRVAREPKREGRRDGRLADAAFAAEEEQPRAAQDSVERLGGVAECRRSVNGPAYSCRGPDGPSRPPRTCAPTAGNATRRRSAASRQTPRGSSNSA